MRHLVQLFISMLLLAPPAGGNGLSAGVSGPGLPAAFSGMRRIPGGEYRLFWRAPRQPEYARVKSFYLDVHAVTNGEFLQFVRANPRWLRSKVSRLFADPNYLHQWAGDVDPGSKCGINSPVTNVSWFAADAYAKWKGKRLPTQAEWEYAASAPPVGMKKKDKLTSIILAWYDHPVPALLPSVGSTYRNTFGIDDMHGLIWEWVADFNSVVTQEDPSGGAAGIAKAFSCAAGSLGSADKEDYAAFMRYAFRGSLQASFTVGSLGFRCACDDDRFKKTQNEHYEK